MKALQARLDSFSQSARVKSTTAKSVASVSLKWPHPSHFKATPNTLADAGFYFNPSWDDRDAVTCYMCSKELSDWAKDDDPFQIHWTKCKKVCAWAVVRCGLIDDVDDDGKWDFSETTRFPSGKVMEKARLETFRDWPYDSERNHGATSKKMARAGFVYTPQSYADDTATCLYCNLSLSGWDADDDPLQEHRKREKKSSEACPFLSTTSPPVKPKVPSSRASSKALSRPKPTKVVDDQSQSASDDELATADVLPVQKKTAGGKSMAPNGGSSDPLRMSTRRSTRVASGKTAASEVEDEGTGGDVGKPAPKKRKGKERKKVEAIEEEVEVEPEPKEAKKQTKRATSKAKQGTDPPEPDVIPVSIKEPSEKKIRRKKKTGRNVVANDADTEAVPSTNLPKTLTRSISYARVDSNSDVPVSPKVVKVPSQPAPPSKPIQQSRVEPDAAPFPKPRKGEKRVAMEAINVPESLQEAKPVELPLPPQATRTTPNPATPPRARVVSPLLINSAKPTLTDGIDTTLFIPPLATIPMPKVVSLTERDLDMTVEEWIRHEMALQYEQFKGDGERAVEMFKQRTAEVRRAIEAL